MPLGALVLFHTACSVTKYVPDDDQLFVGLEKIAYTNYEHNQHAEDTQEEVEAALATAPNGALFGSSYYRMFPYGLWIWNITQESNTKLGHWIGSTFGKQPVLMSQVNPALRAQVAKQVLRTHGYLHGDVSYREVTKKNPKKAKLAYTVTMDTVFRVDTLTYVGFPPAMQLLIDSTLSESTLRPGAVFSVANLDAERTRLAKLFRNKGYYYYQSNYASFLADTVRTDGVDYTATLRLQLADSLPQRALQPWYVGNTSVRLRRSQMERTDSVLGRNFLKVLYSGKRPPIRARVIMQGMKLRPGSLFSYDNYQESMQKVNATGVFSTIDFQFTPRGDSLDLLLDCVFDKPYDFYVETNFVNRTIGRFGPEMRIGLTRRNAFHGGEKLDVNLHGAYEWETSSKGSDMNSYQYGVDASIEFPRSLQPFSSRERRRRMRMTGPTRSVSMVGMADSTSTSRQRRRRRPPYAPPSTIAKFSTDVIRRPSYYKMHIVSGEWIYRWQPSASNRHEFSPLTVKYQFMNSHTERFDSLLYDNMYLSATMEDQFIPKMRYTYTYTSPVRKRHPIRCETSVEESGNITALYDVLVQGNGWQEKDKTLFKNPYAQFLKVETDLTKTWTLNSHAKLVGHINLGLMWCYGNSDFAPFSEMFYVGGANSIRAFPVRSIGPGSFMGLNDRQFDYVIRNGNIKVLMNLELRQRLFGNLYGAVFLDAGNVWSSEDWNFGYDDVDELDEDQLVFRFAWNELLSKGWSFQTRNFFNELATGTGVGLRYDLDFLVLRVDWGFGLHLPYETWNNGYFNIPRFKDMHTLHIAIGYPF